LPQNRRDSEVGQAVQPDAQPAKVSLERLTDEVSLAKNSLACEAIAMSARRTLLLLLIGSLLWAGPKTRGDEVKTLGGNTLTGSVVSVTPTEVEIKTAEGVVKVPLAQVIDLNVRPARPVGAGKFTEVRLLDESLLYASKVAYLGKTVQLSLLSGAVVE